MKKRIVIIGGGFAGLNFAKRLYKNNHYEGILVDKNNYNYFTPLLYQVITNDPAERKKLLTIVVAGDGLFQ